MTNQPNRSLRYVSGVVASEGRHAERVRQALLDVPRSAFAGAGQAEATISGHSIPPMSVLSLMLTALEIEPTAHVLQVGTGSGYAAAVTARLATKVSTIERLEVMLGVATKRFAALGLHNIQSRLGDGRRGWPEQAPFDNILVVARLGEIPEALKAQLKVGGRMAYVTIAHGRESLLRVTRKSRDDFAIEDLGEIGFRSNLADALLAHKLISKETLDRARGAAATSGRTIDQELASASGVDVTELVHAVAAQTGAAYTSLDTLLKMVDLKLLDRVPRAFRAFNQLIPICQKGDEVHVAVHEADAPLDDLEKVFPRCRMVRRLVTQDDFLRLWTILDLRVAQSGRPIEESDSGKQELMTAGAENVVDAHFIALFEALLLDAIGERASDIHLERYGSDVRVRTRIDGELRDFTRYELSTTDAIGLVNVTKVRANLDITEHRRPQGGSIHLAVGGKVYDLRVQTQPSLHGEHLVIRLLPQTAQVPTVEDLGFPAEIASVYRRLLANPAGLVLVVGPTGSGKSTTLYAGLKELAADPRRKVITIEDPIEYSIDRIQQTQVMPDIGFGFASAMRSFVRQDPNVILVGEIRDHETALEAIRASQTGHLVLSTLHCNDTVDAVQRLFDLGMHPNSIAAELLAVIAQRLARRVCTGCSSAAPPDPKILAELYPLGAPADFKSFHGTGCDRCAKAGTHGRIAIAELLRTGGEIRRAIARQVPLDDLRQVALAAGLLPMREHAIALVQAGVIPLSELPRILPVESMAPAQAR